MKEKRVLRYYCEHCKKSGCSKHWMQRHEDSCIHNPNRVCRFHAFIRMDEDCHFISTADLVTIAKTRKGTLNDLRELTMGCPACMLATITQSGLNDSPADEDGYGAQNEFQAWRYKEEKAEFWADRQRIYQP